MNPYEIVGPAAVLLSGRASAYLLFHLLVANGGLPREVHVLFANTGKERPETLDFIHECSIRWDVRVRWVEWTADEPGYREVRPATASRHGEPFHALLRRAATLPRPEGCLCTRYLKVRALQRFVRTELGFEEWTSLVGIRDDERHRWTSLGADPDEPGAWTLAPLIDARVNLEQVLDFWARQPFDLPLDAEERPCGLCFLKPDPESALLMDEGPAIARPARDAEERSRSRSCWKCAPSAECLRRRSVRPLAPLGARRTAHLVPQDCPAGQHP